MPVAQRLGLAREMDARVDASELARRYRACYGVAVEYFDPHTSPAGRRGQLDDRTPPCLQLPALGGVTNYAVAAFALGEWIERMFASLVQTTELRSEAGERLNLEYSPTFRLSPAALGLPGGESGFAATNASFFQGFAALILLGQESDRLLCELMVRAVDEPMSDATRLLIRISETSTLLHQHMLRDYAQANLTFTDGPANATRNIVANTLLASFLADHAISRHTALLGLD